MLGHSIAFNLLVALCLGLVALGGVILYDVSRFFLRGVMIAGDWLARKWVEAGART